MTATAIALQKPNLTDRIVGWQQRHRRLHHAIEYTLGTDRFERIKKVPAPAVVRAVARHDTWYSFFVDALANNIASLPFIFNDKYGAKVGGDASSLRNRTWGEAWTQRGVAAIGNVPIGPWYGKYQDWVIGHAEKVVEEHPEYHSLRKTGIQLGSKWLAFASGQSLGYAGYYVIASALKGEQPTAGEVLGATATLTALAPIVGPWFDWIYQSVRLQFGLEPVSSYRKKQEDASRAALVSPNVSI